MEQKDIFLIFKKLKKIFFLIEQAHVNRAFQIRGHSYNSQTLISKGTFMAKLDFQDVYLLISVHPESGRYLRFQLKGKTY